MVREFAALPLRDPLPDLALPINIFAALFGLLRTQSEVLQTALFQFLQVFLLLFLQLVVGIEFLLFSHELLELATLTLEVSLQVFLGPPFLLSDLLLQTVGLRHRSVHHTHLFGAEVRVFKLEYEVVGVFAQNLVQLVTFQLLEGLCLLFLK